MLERSEDTELNLTRFMYGKVHRFVLEFWQTPRTLKFSVSTLDNKLEDLLFLTPEKLGIHVECKRYIGCLAFISLSYAGVVDSGIFIFVPWKNS